MKKLHLVCNAHIDPAWLWEWDEGISCTLSTYASAVKLAEEFDYIFCHNEAITYAWTEEYAPETFSRIQELVKQGKWIIIGGWDLQPDCILSAGESLVRHISRGRRYFLEKFGKTPVTAVSFDSFGHAFGLPQILKKCGYENYICCRPFPHESDIPDNFIWEGPDGSRILTTRASKGYGSGMGHAVDKIQNVINTSKDDIEILLWGIGNHGGGPSHKDLADIKALMAERDDIEIIHSHPDSFFADTAKREYIYRGSLGPCMPGCHVSQAKIKYLHRKLESVLFSTEKICLHNELSIKEEYPLQEFLLPEKNLMDMQFHDIIPGSGIKEVEEYGLELAYSGLNALGRVRSHAFYKLIQDEFPAENGTFPIFVFNTMPQSFSYTVDAVFGLEDQNRGTDFTDIEVYDEQGNKLPAQVIREKSNVALDWMKRVLFECELKPMSLNRFTCRKKMLSAWPAPPHQDGSNFVFETKSMRAVLSKKTGLLTEFMVNGTSMLQEGGVVVEVYSDNADPWAMSAQQLKQLGTFEGVLELMGEKEGSIYSGVSSTIPSVRLTEDGEVCSIYEAVMHYGKTSLFITYTCYKCKNEMDINITLHCNEKDKIVKLGINPANAGVAVVETAFGREDAPADGRPFPMQKYILFRSGNSGIAIINNGTYGMAFNGKDIRIPLVKSAAYAAHPIDTRPLISQNRYTDRIDLGERNFSFKLCFGDYSEIEKTVDKVAQGFNEKPYSLCAFPSGKGEKTSKQPPVIINNDTIILSAAFKREDGIFVLRLHNNHAYENKAELAVMGIKMELCFGKYEVKTLLYDGKTLSESNSMV